MTNLERLIENIENRKGRGVTFTIERSRGATYDSEDFSIYAHDRYPRSSVLAGRDRRAWIGSSDDKGELIEACKRAKVNVGLGGSTFVEPTGDSLGDLSGLPECPPSWFDPADAGEAWGEEDY